MRTQYRTPFLISLCLVLFTSGRVWSQNVIDTLAFQDFEVVPAAPTWTYSGTPYGFQSGFSTSSATPANSPIGIGGSRAWHVESQGSGNPLTFANTNIPAGYDTVKVRFRLAAFNLTSTSGGPDNLDYVLVEYSTNAGASYVGRVRIRGAINNNCSWPYASGTTASVWYQPTTESVFQPINTGLQVQAGIGTVEIMFPGSISQLQMRITPRSSTTSDDWLVDNLVLEGWKTCTNSTASISPQVCDSYQSPAGNIYTSTGVYSDTIQNGGGCDSIITINLTVDPSTYDTLTPAVCGTYTSPSGQILTSSGTYQDTIPNAAQCDSVITIHLTVNTNQADTLTDTACFSYISPSQNYVWDNSGTYWDTIPTAAGCDSLLVINLTINQVDTAVTQVSTDSLAANAAGAAYQWVDCNNNYAPVAGATQQGFRPASSGNYAVVIEQNGCRDTSGCYNVILVGLDGREITRPALYPNPVHDRLSIDCGQLILNGELILYDQMGRQIARFFMDRTHQTDIPVSQLPQGIYLIELRSQQLNFILKFTKI